jgi:hypothetical protein
MSRTYRYQDYLDEKGTTTSKAVIMTGGVKAWLKRFEGNNELVDYDD